MAVVRGVTRIGAAFALGAVISAAQGAGTPAGTVITNTATLSYSFGGGPAANVISLPASVTVAEVINLNLTWQDASSVTVNSPSANAALTFLLSNTGNGPETFVLSRNNALAGDTYDPQNAGTGAIFLENGLQPGFQATGPNADTLYVPGNNDPVLSADAARTIYLASDTPAGLASGATGNAELTAASATPGAAGAAPGTVLTGKGAGGVDAVVASGLARRIGSYVVGGIAVTVAKSVVKVVDSQGGASVTAGAELTYRIVLTALGSGTAQNLLLNDPLPPNTSYVAQSITVNGVARTDAADADNAEFSGGALKVNFGNTAAPASFTVEFRVTVN